jgi:hypothetical protein
MLKDGAFAPSLLFLLFLCRHYALLKPPRTEGKRLYALIILLDPSDGNGRIDYSHPKQGQKHSRRFGVVMMALRQKIAGTDE